MNATRKTFLSPVAALLLAALPAALMADRDADVKLCDAASDGDSQKCSNLIELGASPDAVDEAGVTALMKASSKGHKHIMKFLLEQGADINAVDNTGRTALMVAAMNGYNLDALNFLISKKAKLDAQDRNGLTALMFAARGGYLQAVKALLAAGADLSIKNSDDKTAEDAAREAGHKKIADAIRFQKDAAFNDDQKYEDD